MGIFRDKIESDTCRSNMKPSDSFVVPENAELFRSAFELSAIGMALVAPNGKFLKVNRAFCEFVGYSEEDLLDIDFQAITFADDLDEDLNHVQRLLGGEIATYRMEKRYIHRSGEVVWGLLSVSLIRDFQGAPLFFISQIQDINDRKQSEYSLRQYAIELDALQSIMLQISTTHDLPYLLNLIVEHAAKLLDAPSAGMYLCEADQKQLRCVVSYNTVKDYTGTLLQYGEGAAGIAAQTGKPVIVDDYRKWEGRARVYEEDNPFLAVLSVPMIWNNQVMGVLHVLHQEEGRYFTETDQELLGLFAAHAAIAVENARLFQSAQQELAERKKAMEELRLDVQIMENLADGVFLYRPDDGVIFYANSRLEAMFGYAPDELIGKNISILDAPGEIPPADFANETIDAIKKHKVWHGEVHNIRKDGTAFWCSASVTTFEHKEYGTVFISINQDISERKKAEKLQQAIYQIAQAAVSSKSLDELFLAIHQTLGELMRVENFYIALLDAASNMLSFPYFVDPFDEFTPLAMPMHGLTEYVLRTKRSLLATPEVFTKLVEEGEVRLVGTNSVDWLGAPLIVEDRVIGVMVTQSYSETLRFSQQDLDFLSFVSTQVAQAIERKQAEESLVRHANRLADILKLAIEFTSMHDERILLDTLVQRAAEILESATCTVLLVDMDTNEAVLVAQTGLPEGSHANLRVPLELPPIRNLVERGEPLILSDIDQQAPAMRSILLRPDIQAFFAYPMIHEGQAKGVITFSKVYKYIPSPEEITACRLLAERAAAALENMRLFDETNRRLKQAQTLHALDKVIVSSLDIHLTLQVLVEQIKSQLNVDAVAILLFNQHTQMLDFSAGAGFRTSTLQDTHLRLGQGYAGLACLERKTLHLTGLRERKTDFLRSPTFALEQFEVYFCVPLIARGSIKGALEVFHRSPLQPVAEWRDFFETIARQTSLAMDNAQLVEDLQRSNVELVLAYDSTLLGWSKALDLRDKETEGHTQRVTELTERLARIFHVSEFDLIHIRRGAMLHDIGKMGIPDTILLKNGFLTPEEMEVMRKHPQFAYQMLEPIAYLRQSLDIPYCHHEKWDGTGYPRGISGELIPLAARLFAVVDVWDALTTDRPYRKAWTEEEARLYLCEQAGKHFDPRVVSAFVEMIGKPPCKNHSNS